MYAIIDVETTGTGASYGKITEIAIVLHNGEAVTETYNSLINPECNIPWNITRLTGITNDMVAHAPKFYEVAKKIVELTAGRIFVAHNAQFDYSFVKEEFKRLGYDFKRKTICTVKLGRKLLPGHRSYSLGNICSDLGIQITDRHRAIGDALATAKLFDILLSQNNLLESSLFVHQTYPLSNEKMAAIPGKTGVYYFYDTQGNIIYVGKSKDIHQRVLTHFSNSQTKKAIEMRDKIADVSWEETGSELVALLLESSEIKMHKPLYNRSQRRSAFNFGLFSFEDSAGYLHLKIKPIEGEEIPLTTFHFQPEGLDYLHNLADKYALCKKLCHLDSNSGECFESQIHHCQGACIGLESPANYNLRVNKSVYPLQYRSPNFFVIDQGRNNDENAIIKISSGRYVGFGYISTECASNNLESLHDCIQKHNDNRDIRVIIKGYLNRSKNLKIIEI
ncbi:MAG TPA: exonuclease domain-containing protein [Prolixibacteraceae bacterium]|nr:exonuclease domain-containing protein [Prolixibacteraceae bacterium]